MKKITIMYDGSVYTKRWLWTLIWAKKSFLKKDICFKFVPIQNIEKLNWGGRITVDNQSRIVCLAFHDGVRNLPDTEKFLFLQKLRNRFEKIIWFDTSDSSGTCNFEVLPYVDKYLKKQLLKDIELYTKEMYGCRPHSEFFHSTLGVTDDLIGSQKMRLLDLQYEKKLGLSWNVGLSNINSHGVWNNVKNRFLFPFFEVNGDIYRYGNPSSARSIDIQFQGTFTSSGVGWQRMKAREIIQLNDSFVAPAMSKNGSFREYMREMSNSKCILGLFSFGEICYRDFEAFISGSCLLKPNMSHIITFPDWFQENTTYVPLSWDLSDLEEKLTWYLDNENIRVKIAEQGQMLFRKMLGEEGKKQFVNHFVEEIL